MPSPFLSAVVREPWFIWGLALRLVVWLLLAHAHEIAVFQDASRQMLTGGGVYTRFAPWIAATGDGYYAAPPLYAYMLWVSGRLNAALGDHWWLHQLLIKNWLLLADLAVMAYLLHRTPTRARAYWTMWVVPVVAIGQVQPDLWIGLCVLASFHLAHQGRWLGVGLLLGLGAGFKPVPLLLLPFLAAYLIRTGRPKALPQVGFGVLAALIATWLPYSLMFPDIRQATEVLRYHATRPIAGLTVPSGVLVIVNAGLVAIQTAGIRVSWAAYDAVVRAGVAFPVLTTAAFAALFAAAAVGRRWSLAQTFCLPLLLFLAANKVVHEHYLLQVLPLLIVLGANLRGLIFAFSVYVLAAGGPLRFLPAELGLPSSIDTLLPPMAGTMLSLTLAIAAGAAAVIFGYNVLMLTASFIRRGERCAIADSD